MKCLSCGIEIPPQWVNALKNNSCPACGKEIMSKDIQELINGLSEALEKMPNNPQGIACWITSNYKLEKIADYEPTQFTTAKKPGNINRNATNSEQKTAVEKFFERAQVNLAEIPSRKAKVPPQVKTMDDIEGDDQDVVEADGNEPLDEIDRMILNGNGGGSMSDDEKDAIASVIQNAKFGSMENNSYLNESMEKQKQRQENIANGIGATSRSGKPAGFRRAD